MLVWMDNVSGKDMFNTNHDKMIRVGLSFIWPLTLITIFIMLIRRNK
jgi:hypothetical protein